MTTELEHLRAFRAADAQVDDDSRLAAREALLAHVGSRPSADRRWLLGSREPVSSAARGRRLIRGGAPALGVVLSVAVTVGVIAIAFSLAGHRSTRPVAGAQSPKRQELINILGVLRRLQTPADRSFNQTGWPEPPRAPGSHTQPDRSLIRLATVTPWGAKVFIVPLTPPRNPYASALGETIALWVQGIGWSDFSTVADVKAGQAWGPERTVQRPGRAPETRFFELVPDGVARVVLLPPRFGGSITAVVHHNIATFQAHWAGAMPVSAIWYARDGRVIKRIGDFGNHLNSTHPSGPGAPAINLSPGVVTVARLRLPDGTPFQLTLQRVRFQRHQYVCLAVTEPGRSTVPGIPAPGPQTAQQCEGPIPLPSRPLVAVMGDPTSCKPYIAQLIWGLALTDVNVALRSGGRDQAPTRRPIPAALRARGNVFYVWARDAPDSLVARNPAGKIVETYPINSGRVPVFAAECNLPWPNGSVAQLQLQSRPSTP